MSKSKGSRCKARAKSGQPCKAAATSGGLCFFHANPNKASELGRIGGRTKSRAADVTDPLPKLNRAAAVGDVVEKLISDVYANKLHPRVAAGLAPLLSLQLRVVQATEWEQRIENLEKLFKAKAEDESRSNLFSAEAVPESGH